VQSALRNGRSLERASDGLLHLPALFGGLLEVTQAGACWALETALGDATTLDAVRDAYADYLAEGGRRRYAEFLEERMAPEPRPAPATAGSPRYLVRVQLPGGGIASGLAIAPDRRVVTAASAVAPEGTPAPSEVTVSFEGDAQGRPFRVGEVRSGLAILDPVQPASPLRADELPGLIVDEPTDELLVHHTGATGTAGVTVSVIESAATGEMSLAGTLPPQAIGAPVLADGRLFAIVTLAGPDGAVEAQAASILSDAPFVRAASPRPIAVGRLGGAGNDRVAREDQLGFKHYVHAFAQLIDSPYTQPPVTVGIYGSWGTGKSFLLQTIEARLKDEEFQDRPNESDLPRPKVHVVSFNAWEYSASDIIWPGLVRKIMTVLEDESPTGFGGRFLGRLRRNLLRQIRVARARIIAGVTVLVAVLLVALSQSNLDADVALGVVSALGVGGLVKLVSDTVNDPLGQWFTTLFEDRHYGGQIGYMAEIKHDLDGLQQGLQQRNGRVLVIIDDLDRCEPDKAVEVLQAINLLLNFESFIVCLGIDARVITRAVERHYQDLLNESGASGFEYLDKIVQIPFRIPEPSDTEIRTFLNKQLGEPKPHQETDLGGVRPPADGAGAGHAEDTTTVTEPIPPPRPEERQPLPPIDAQPPVAFEYDELKAFRSLTPYLRPNPRHLKRLVNVYRLVRTLAALKGDAAVYEDPDATLRWLVIAAQWPYAASRMLQRFSEHLDDWDTEIPADVRAVDPLLYLLKEVAPELSDASRKAFDDDKDLLQDLLDCKDGRLSWEQLRVIRPYTVNFNPAVEQDLTASVPAHRAIIA
jgi:Cdc6-like AAA superfamily ATPase